jgi:shikimate kinase / 3-dehydroquinate synthase
MSISTLSFSGKKVDYIIDDTFETIHTYHPKEKILLITDTNMAHIYQAKIKSYNTIVVEGKEQNKNQETVDGIIEKMLALSVDKSWMLIGLGGGVITDMVGYISAIYKRGLKLGLVPTSILAMCDAAIGGKNGVNVGNYKNMVGTLKQPEFILFDFEFLKSLPKEEFINGFAEIIKHACIKDKAMFEELSQNNIAYYLQNENALKALITRNINIKNEVVLNDEFETADRYLLNFGHTFGHAIENTYNIMHGYAISIGMVIAAKLSEQVMGFSKNETQQIIALLEKYNLPTQADIDLRKTLEILKQDKKADGADINFVFLQEIGIAQSKKIAFKNLSEMINKL